jgi:nucleoside-diphosphate-sugar epimerase
VTGLVLVTGASGLIGGHLVAQLLAARRRVRALVRNPGFVVAGLPARADIVKGDIRDRGAVGAALVGVDTVLHLAACARAWSRDPGEFTAVNVDAVAALLDAAQGAGVRRLVHVSTVLTLPGLYPAPSHSGRLPTPYEASKLEGERLVQASVARGLHAVVVHPTRVYGPGPLNDANGVTRLISLHLNGPMVVRLDDGDVLANYVHAADVAAGILLAAERGEAGGHYLLGGENSSLRNLLDLVGEISGVRRRILSLPRAAALAAAHASLLWGRLGGTATITPAWVRSFYADQRIDCAATCRALGYRPRTLRAGLEETITWLRQRISAAS